MVLADVVVVVVVADMVALALVGVVDVADTVALVLVGMVVLVVERITTRTKVEEIHFVFAFLH